jgi:hypothetical protein
MKSFVARGLVVVLAIFALAYLLDYGWLRIRISQGESRAFDTLQVEVVDVIPQKGNKAEYVPEGAQSETCVRSLFPHSGSTPCWYLKRHAVRQVNF